MAVPLGAFVQPTLYVPPDIQAGIANGTLFLSGSVVRKVVGKTIYKHLDEVPNPSDAAEELAKRAVKVAPKVLVPFVVVTAAAVAGVAYALKRRKNARGSEQPVPECVASFEESLRAYVDAGRAGALDAATVERLINDLDAVRAWSDEGNTVEFSFAQLEPLFSLVISHTSALAAAYSVTLTEMERPEADAGVVVQLRQHLEAQRKILTEAA